MYSPWWREVHLGSHLFWHHSDTYIDIRKQVFTCTCTLWLIIYESSKRKSSVSISFLAESKFSFQIINFSMLENFDNFVFFKMLMSKSAECRNCPRRMSKSKCICKMHQIINILGPIPKNCCSLFSIFGLFLSNFSSQPKSNVWTSFIFARPFNIRFGYSINERLYTIGCRCCVTYR